MKTPDPTDAELDELEAHLKQEADDSVNHPDPVRLYRIFRACRQHPNEAVVRLAELKENYRAIAAALNGLHSTIFGVANGKDPNAALSALKDGGVIHEQAHVLLRILWPKNALAALDNLPSMAKQGGDG